MCEFKSGIILRNKVVLAPEGDESHSNLLESLNIEDTHMNACKVFVRAELTPTEGNKVEPVKKWKYRVDQDIIPDWYNKDPGRYEAEMRESVKEYMKNKIKDVICGYDWVPIQDGELTYYFMNGVMFSTNFGKTNDYRSSCVREKLLSSTLLASLKEKFGDKLLPIKLDLTSMDGLKDYGSVESDLIAIPTIGLLMKYGSEITLTDKGYWLATPNQTLTRNDSSYVRYVCSYGSVNYDDCFWRECGVRPFFIIRS